MNLEFRRIEPAPDLATHVRHYWVLLGGASGGPGHPVFPDGCGEIVFNLGSAPAHELQRSGRLTVQPRAMLVGQMTRPLQMVPGGALRMVGIKLAPWGAAAIIGEASAALRDRTVALSDIDPTILTHLGEQLDGCSADDIGAVLDHALRARLEAAGARRLNGLTRLARSLGHTPGASVEAWARASGCSARTLERRFDRFIGISPKEFSRVRRFQRALRLARERPTLRWAAIAAGAGYSDQAHLGRDFRQFAGCPPTLMACTGTPITAAFVSDQD